jgi:hypothetical protein
MKIGPSEGNSGAIVRWGRHLDNGVWFSWRFWSNRNMLTRFRILPLGAKYIAVGLLTVQWGNK